MTLSLAPYSDRLKRFLLHPWFLGILAVKAIFGSLLASDFMAKGFAPFVDYFVRSGFQNPYDHFLGEGLVKVFPYSTVMLWVLAVPRVIFSFLFQAGSEVISFLHLFLMRFPILIADIGIYLILCFWLPAREKKVLLFYWASPILFYINYFHGQLDVIPTALLFFSLACLFRGKTHAAYLLLGLGMAAKTHLLAVLPFYFLYSYLKKTSAGSLLKYIASAIVIWFVMLLPYLFSAGYQELVLKAEEQGWVFLLQLPYGEHGAALLLAPAIYLILFFRFASSSKITQDFLLIMLGLVFASLVVFVPPMPGWFYWSLPLLAYFYIKKPGAPTLNFWLLNFFFLAYFLFHKNSDIFSAFQIISPSFAVLPTPYAFVESIGRNAQLVSNIFFTGLAATLVMNIVWCYRIGLRDHLAYREKIKPLLIGIGGDSGTGKSTLADLFTKFFSEGNVVRVEGDDAHRWPRGHENWEVFTHLDPKSNRLHRDLKHAIALKAGRPIERVHYDHKTGRFTNPEQMDPNKVVLFEGLHPYALTRTRDLFDVKIFLEPEENLRIHWKLLRDMGERSHDRKKVLEQLRKRSSDTEKFIRPQRELADIVVSYESTRPLQALGSPEEKCELRLKLTFENSLDIEPLIQALQNVETLDVDYTYEDLHKISLTCTGDISSRELEQIAFRLIPNIREFIQGTPSWEPGLSGILQLFVLYYLCERQIFKEEQNV